MSYLSDSFSVQMDQTGTPRARGTWMSVDSNPLFEAGPVAEGAGLASEAGVRTAEPTKGDTKKKAFIVVGCLLILAAIVCGVGYVTFLRPETSSSASVIDTDAGDDSSLVSDRSVDITTPGSEGTPAVPPASTLPIATIPPASTLPIAPVSTATVPPATVPPATVPPLTAAPPAAVPPTTAPPLPPPPARPLLNTIPVNPALGSYDKSIPLPVIPVAAAVLPSGKVLAWSAYSPDNFWRPNRYVVGGGGSGKTEHTVFDPATNEATSLLVSNTNHDMFCPGISMMHNGDILVTGGQNANKTSVYQLASNKWLQAAEMTISRGYGSSVTMSDGKVFVLGGSWSGPTDLAKDAEVYHPTRGVWSSLPGIQAATILTDDPEDALEGRIYRADNYGMFHAWSDATVFHAGPSTAMFWFSTFGSVGTSGITVAAGTRPGGNIANGNSVMFDTGKILNCGGAEAFALEGYTATDFATLITITTPNVPAQVKTLPPMKLPRVYANGVVLPDGKVLITGGASTTKEFSDEFAYYQPEIWDPATEEFTLLDAKHEFGRTYHSTAALLPDGRVFTGGGGLCGSGTDGIRSLCKGDVDPNHLDTEIFNPPYLFAADGSLAERPMIEISDTTAKHGDLIEVDSSEQLMMISMIRMGTVTHSTNTDQRRIELCGPFTALCPETPVTVRIPSDAGIAVAGYWMIFGVNADGVPSVASTLLVGI